MRPGRLATPIIPLALIASLDIAPSPPIRPLTRRERDEEVALFVQDGEAVKLLEQELGLRKPLQ